MKETLLIICLLFSITVFSQQTQEESFSYEREWATYLPHINTANTVVDFFTLSDNSLFFFSTHQASMPFLDNLYPFPPDAEGNLTVGALNLEGQLEWVDKFRLGEETTSVYNVTIDEDDYIYFVGRTRDSLHIGTPGTHMPEYIPHFYNDTVYVGGQEVIGNFPGYAHFIAKYDTSGNQIWGSYIVGEKSMSSIGRVVKQGDFLYYYGSTNSKSGIATPGTYISTAPAPLPPEITETYTVSFIMKFDANTGERLWGTYFPIHELDFTFNTSGNARPAIDSAGYAYFNYINTFIKLNPDGTYNSTLSNSDNLIYDFIIQFDSEGNIYTLARNKPNDNTNFGTAGTYKPNKTIEDEHLLIKLTPNFEKIWATYLGSTVGATYETMIINEWDNEILISSSTALADNTTPNAFQTEYGGGDLDAVLMSFDMETGQRNWFSYYGDSETDRGNRLVLADEHSFYFIGLSEGGDNIISEESLYTSEDFGVWYGHIQIPFVAKFTSTKTSSVDELPRDTFKVYPNPSSDKVFVESVSQWRNDISLALYTLQGKYLTTEVQAIGTGYTIDMSQLPAGFYLLKVSTADGAAHYKLIKE